MIGFIKNELQGEQKLFYWGTKKDRISIILLLIFLKFPYVHD